MALRLLTGLLLCGGMVTAASAGEPVYGRPVNGYTWVAPSYYLTPPVIRPVVVAPPTPIVVDPLWGPGYDYVTPIDAVYGTPVTGGYVPGAVYRDRVKVRPRSVEYRARVLGPDGRRHTYKQEIEYKRRGVEIDTDWD